MRAETVSFFGMIRGGSYRHVGHGPLLKSYSYVGNLIRQYACLMDARAEDVANRVFYLADYAPLSLRWWADSMAAATGAPSISTMPVWMAQIGARIGDVLNALGARSFPFNSFRLQNVLTQYLVDTQPIEKLCPILPYTAADGVAATAAWLRGVWSEEQ